MSMLRRIVAAADPSLAMHGVPEPPLGPYERTVEDPSRAFVLEAVYEGFLLHYGQPRAFQRMDDDLRLLAGDTLYAMGLERLAEEGDLDAVAELADLISVCAWAEAEGRLDLAETAWEATALRLAGRGGAGARSAVEPQLRAGRGADAPGSA